jgi:hypothetical protein
VSKVASSFISCLAGCWLLLAASCWLLLLLAAGWLLLLVAGWQLAAAWFGLANARTKKTQAAVVINTQATSGIVPGKVLL